MTKVRGFSKGTYQFLTFTRIGCHPIVKSKACSFLDISLPKLVAIGSQQKLEYERAVAR